MVLKATNGGSAQTTTRHGSKSRARQRAKKGSFRWFTALEDVGRAFKGVLGWLRRQNGVEGRFAERARSRADRAVYSGFRRSGDAESKKAAGTGVLSSQAVYKAF